ncbi:hypothetical protein AX14_004793 [Amanita brunnescens Koide BX004]|nr:hypothetical protein AX14_004793 [Amanita brunnescens Koide BX004]
MYLQGLSGFAVLTVGKKIAMTCMTMVVVTYSPPNYAAAKMSLGINPGPVVTKNFTNLSLYAKVNGVMMMVVAYSGAMIFPEIMAEMKRPMDFWKCLVLTQIFAVMTCLLQGCFVYAYQGQFSMPLAFQGISVYLWQTVANVMLLASGITGMGLYGNIAVKVIYISVIEDILKGPRLMSSKGRFVWIGLVLVYWAIAFLVGSSIPQIQAVGGLIGAVAIMQFTYTFPPLLWLGYQVMIDAMIDDKAHSPCCGCKGRIDTWQEWSRWKRGLFGGRWYFKMFNLMLGLAGFTIACMGIWAAGATIQETFAIAGAATSFGCAAPV